MPHSSQSAHNAVTMTPAMVMLFAFCCGAIVANIYYAQPIIELIAPDIGLSSTAASLIVSLTAFSSSCRWVICWRTAG